MRIERALFITAFFLVAFFLPREGAAETGPIQAGGFTCTHVVTLPGTPEEVYDAATGDISAWWDHSFSGNPARLYIEPKPGGGFFEIFDESGDGVRHATVLYAERGKALRFEGPLGLSGHAVLMVTTYTFEPAGEDSTRFLVDVRASGEVKEGWPEVVDRTWHHFLFERFAPYLEAGGLGSR
ncbi:MAG: SRPBCC domain-containing protein [Candidatus Eisenbacteria bacterium]